MSILQILLPAVVAGLILTGMLAYLGVHVVERGVIFVDLSLAQIAAFGTTVGVLFGYDVHSPAGYFFSLAFTFLGAGVFALSRVHRSTRIPQEAIIGIAYAVAAAASILAMSKVVGETEHLKEMLVGNILSVSWSDLGRTAALFAVIGVFHFALRRKFLLISMNEADAERQGVSIRFSELLLPADVFVSEGGVCRSPLAAREQERRVANPAGIDLEGSERGDDRGSNNSNLSGRGSCALSCCPRSEARLGKADLDL